MKRRPRLTRRGARVQTMAEYALTVVVTLLAAALVAVFLLLLPAGSVR